jgi:hypothetical protein
MKQRTEPIVQKRPNGFPCLLVAHVVGVIGPELGNLVSQLLTAPSAELHCNALFAALHQRNQIVALFHVLLCLCIQFLLCCMLSTPMLL